MQIIYLLLLLPISSFTSNKVKAFDEGFMIGLWRFNGAISYPKERTKSDIDIFKWSPDFLSLNNNNTYTLQLADSAAVETIWETGIWSLSEDRRILYLEKRKMSIPAKTIINAQFKIEKLNKRKIRIYPLEDEPKCGHDFCSKYREITYKRIKERNSDK